MRDAHRLVRAHGDRRLTHPMYGNIYRNPPTGIMVVCDASVPIIVVRLRLSGVKLAPTATGCADFPRVKRQAKCNDPPGEVSIRYHNRNMLIGAVQRAGNSESALRASIAFCAARSGIYVWSRAQVTHVGPLCEMRPRKPRKPKASFGSPLASVGWTEGCAIPRERCA
jgi:hypothetical protein